MVNMSAAALRFLFCDAPDRPNLVKGFRNQRIPRKLPRHMTVEEIERLTQAVTDIRYRTAITLSCGVDLRKSETVGVTVSDFIGVSRRRRTWTRCGARRRRRRWRRVRKPGR